MSKIMCIIYAILYMLKERYNVNTQIRKIGIIGAVIAALVFFYYKSPLHAYISFDYIKAQSLYFKTLVDQHYMVSALAYMGLFAAGIAGSLPVSIIATLLGGYLFGAWIGTLFATIAVVIGVGIAYIIMRYVLKSAGDIQTSSTTQTLAHAINQYGVSYLLFLHFSAVVPYVVINTCAAIAHIPLSTVLWTTMLGFLPQALVYAYAGRELGSLQQINDIFSREIMIAFALLMLLALVPMLIKRYKKTH